jgi:hypothetical protein
LDDYDVLSKKLESKLSKFASPLNEALIVKSFIRKPVNLQDKIMGKLVAELIRDGFLLNTIKNNHTIIPEVSLFLVKQWVKTQDTNNNYLVLLLARIFELDSSLSFNFSSFETFTVFWLAIRCYCLRLESQRESEVYDIRRELFLGKGKVSSWKDRSIHLPSPIMLESSTITQILNSKVKLNVIYRLEHSNEGFGSVMFFEDQGTLCAMAMENKFSLPGSTTKFDSDDAMWKWSGTVNNLSQLNIPEENIYLVLFCWRNCTQSIILPKNTLLLQQEELEFLFGPLGRRPYFGFPNKKE